MDSKKINILKIPFDLGISEPSKRGASKAPDLIEKELNQANNLNFINTDISQDFKETHQNIYLRAKKHGPLISLGGDHSISYSLIKAFKEKYPKSALIVLDAHFDCQEPFDLPTHEDYLRLLVKEKIVNPLDISIIGARSYTSIELEFIQKNNIKHIAPNQFNLKILKEFLKNYNSVYLTIDIDVLDPSTAPGTGWRAPNGLNLTQVNEVINSLQYCKEFALDIVEASPLFDVNNTTIKSIANTLLNFSKNL